MHSFGIYCVQIFLIVRLTHFCRNLNHKASDLIFRGADRNVYLNWNWLYLAKIIFVAADWKKPKYIWPYLLFVLYSVYSSIWKYFFCILYCIKCQHSIVYTCPRVIILKRERRCGTWYLCSKLNSWSQIS